VCLAAAAGADPAEPFAIHLGNNTDKDLFLALHYRKPAVDPWVTEGFWKIPAKSRIPITTACDTELYIYAESALGYFGGGDKTLPVGEKPFPRDPLPAALPGPVRRVGDLRLVPNRRGGTPEDNGNQEPHRGLTPQQPGDAQGSDGGDSPGTTRTHRRPLAARTGEPGF
jgi:hypothetical protein